eukprot:scaffold25461_cov21-Tisochrysis_lutea.AAC.1
MHGATYASCRLGPPFWLKLQACPLCPGAAVAWPSLLRSARATSRQSWVRGHCMPKGGVCAV